MRNLPSYFGVFCCVFILSCSSEEKANKSNIHSTGVKTQGAQSADVVEDGQIDSDQDARVIPQPKTTSPAKAINDKVELAKKPPADPKVSTKTATSTETRTEPVPTNNCLEAPSAFVCEVELEITKLTAAERLKAGISALTFERELGYTARVWSVEQAARNVISHEWFISGELTRRHKEKFMVDPLLSAENVAMVPCLSSPQDTAKSFMNGWMQSEGHRANILREGQSRIGVGVAVANGYCFGTQDFGF